jgi:hypothetical protein
MEATKRRIGTAIQQYSGVYISKKYQDALAYRKVIRLHASMENYCFRY